MEPVKMTDRRWPWLGSLVYNNRGWIPLTLWLCACCLAADRTGDIFKAIRTGDESAVTKWIQAGGEPNWRFGAVTPLTLAAFEGKIKIMQVLLLSGADINASAKEGPPLLYAAGGRQPTTMRLLLHCGADVRARGPSGETALHRAVMKDNVNSAKMLIGAGALVDAAEGRGFSPLMLAAWQGNLEMMCLLLEAGADPACKSKSGLTAHDFARAGEHAAALQLLKKSTADNGLPRDASRPAPGTDLTQLTFNARDGQVIVLGPGEYSGVIVAEGKSLTVRGDPRGRTVLKGGESNVLAHVSKGGSLNLQRLHFWCGGKVEFGLFMSEGKARVTHATFTGGKVGVYAEKADLVIRSSRFDKISDVAVSVRESDVSLLGSVIQACPRGLSSGDSTSVRVMDCRFAETPAAVCVVGKKTKVSVKYNTYAASSVPERSIAFYAEGEQVIIVSGNRIVGAYGAIRTKSENPRVALVDNAVFNAESGLMVSATGQKQRMAYVNGNLICNTRSVGIGFDGDVTPLLIRNTVIAGKGHAVYKWKEPGGVFLTDCVLYSPEYGIGFDKAEQGASYLRNARIVAGKVASSANVPRDAATSRFERVLAEGDAKERIQVAAEGVNVAAAKLGPGQKASLSRALDSFCGRITDVEHKAKRLAMLRVQVTDRTGDKRYPFFQVYRATGPRPGHIELTVADLKDPVGLVKQLKDGADAASKYLFSKLPTDLQSKMRQNDRKTVDPTMRRALIDALNRLLPSPGLYERNRFAHVALSNAVKERLEWENKTKIKWRQLNRYVLEDTYPDKIATSRYWVPEMDNDGYACLTPGVYWVAPEGAGLRHKLIMVEPGSRRDLEFVSRDRQWLTIDQQGHLVEKETKTGEKATKELRPIHEGRSPLWLLLPLKSPLKMRQALARVRRVDRGAFAFPRFDVPAEERAALVDKARKALSDLEIPPTDPGVHERLRYLLSRKCIARILSAHGDADDVKRIVSRCAKDRGEYAWDVKRFWTPVVSYMEVRLGSLETGQLAGLLKHKDRRWATLAGVYLHEYGSRMGDSTLIAYLDKGDPDEDLTDQVAWALLDTPDPKVLGGMRRQLNMAIKKAENATFGRTSLPGGVFLYMMTYGSPEDWRAISSLTHTSDVVEDLIFIASDPGLLVEPTEDWACYFRMLSGLRDFPRSLRYRTAIAYAEAVLDKVWEALVRPDDDFGQHMRKSVKARDAQRDYRAYASYWYPHGSADALWNASSPPVLWRGWLTWTRELCDPVHQLMLFTDQPQPATLTESFDCYAKSCAELRKELEKHSAYKYFVPFDLLVSSHRLTTRAFCCSVDDFDDGIDRRAYDVHVPGDKGGEIAGVVEVRPRLVGNILQLACRLNLSYFHFFGEGFDSIFSRGEGLASSKLFPYRMNGARKLMAGIHLHHGDKELPLEFNGIQPDGAYLYEAKLARPDLSNLCLELKMTCLKDTRSLVFDLFASRYARKLQRLKELDEKRKGDAEAKPKDPAAWMAWADVTEAVGNIDEAMKRYQKAIDLDPKSEQAWSKAADMCARYDHPERAVEVLRTMAERFPNNPANWYDLASQLYLTRAYAEGAQACVKALAIRSDHQDVRVLQAACLYLSCERTQAAEALGTLPPGSARERTFPLRYLSLKTTKGASTEKAESALTKRFDRLKGEEQARLGLLLGRSSLNDAIGPDTSAADRCRAHCFAAYYDLLSGNSDAAAKGFADAVAVGTLHQLETRMAEVELARLKGR